MTNEQLTQSVMALNSQVASMNQSVKNMCERLNVVEHDAEEHRQILVYIERLTNHMTTVSEKVESLDSKFDKFGTRVTTLEMRPATMWDKSVAFILGAILSGVVAYALKLLIK